MGPMAESVPPSKRGRAVKPGPADFDPQSLLRSVIAIPLIREIESKPRKVFDVIIDINLDFKPWEMTAGSLPGETDPRVVAKQWLDDFIGRAIRGAGGSPKAGRQGMDALKTSVSQQYVFARLSGPVIRRLVDIDQENARTLRQQAEARRDEVARQASGGAVPGASPAADPIPVSRFRTIHQIWPDFELRSCVTRSIRTVKADAAQQSFSAVGKDITWAVADSGIDAGHPHFALHGNIDRASPYHADFTNARGGQQPLKDEYGHGTHVAGIIAGEYSRKKQEQAPPVTMAWRERDAQDALTQRSKPLDEIRGIAPECKLVSLKVLDKLGTGKASNVIAALSHIQIINGYGRDLKIHGVNLSLGHRFDPKWFACGQSPLCVEVNRLVKSGVVVVIAAGNSGYGTLDTAEGAHDACLDLTINDPGNAEYAITVGATHRDMPHRYGVSYFSSKGPTGDGRCKPDLLAPGERIVSCAAAGAKLVAAETESAECQYFETSGTSMAAPHVSGAIAAFLSIRREFIGEAEKVKQVFMASATDLGRDRYFQGAGLLDLMRAIQSV